MAKLHVEFKSNPAIPFTPTSNDPSPTAAVTFKSNPAIVFAPSVFAPLVKRPVTFRSNPAIVFAPTSPDRQRTGAAVRWKKGASYIQHLAVSGTLPGVTIAAVGGRCGTGAGALVAFGDGERIAWRAPGSSTFGADVKFGGDSTRYLLDGDDPDAWIQITVDVSELPDGPQSAQIMLADRFGGEIAGADVTQSEASVGNIGTTALTLANEGLDTITTLAVWIDASYANGLEISWDTITWHTPTNEADAIATMGYAPSLAAAASQTLTVRRTITAGAAADPRVPVVLHASFDHGDSDTAKCDTRGLYRVANAAVYRLYRKLGGPPVPGVDAVWDTTATLPYTPTPTFPDGDWWVAVTFFNGYLESSAREQHRFRVSGGASIELKSAGPLHEALTVLAGGVVRVTAQYAPDVDPGYEADEWAIWTTYDGSEPDPDVDAVAAIVPMDFTLGYDRLEFDLPVQAGGTTVKVVVRTRRNSTLLGVAIPSENTDVVSATASDSGPTAAGGGQNWTGRVPAE